MSVTLRGCIGEGCYPARSGGSTRRKSEIMAFVLALLLAAALVSPAGEGEVLRVGMDTRSRPWVFVPGLDYSKEDFARAPGITPAQVEQLQGVEIDILEAVARRLGVKTQDRPGGLGSRSRRACSTSATTCS